MGGRLIMKRKDFREITEDENIEKLIKSEGIQNTKYIIQEELGELQKEISKDLRGKLNRNNFLEEMADVVIVMHMAKFIYNISDEELEEWVNKKMKRNLERNGL